MGKPPVIIALPFLDTAENCVPELCVNRQYGAAIKRAGGILLAPISLNNNGPLEKIMDGLLLCGGDDIDPGLYHESKKPYTRGVDVERDSTEIKLLSIAIGRQIPILGICRGMELANVFFKGTLWQDLKKEFSSQIQHDNSHNHPRDYLAHEVSVDKDSRLFNIIKKGKVKVNGLHHQGIKKLGDKLRAAAWAKDGLIEAIELPGHPFFIGVQWHPEELIADAKWLNLFKAFVGATKAA